MKRRWIGFLAAAACAMLPACASIEQGNAQTELAQGNLDAAVADVQSALASNPDDLQLKQLAAQIFTQRGVKYYQSKEMLAAGDDFHRAVDYDQFYGQAWDYLGLIAFSQARWAEAIDHGHKAAELQGKPDPAYVQQAEQQLVKVRTGGLGPPHHNHPAAAATGPNSGSS
jgi:tetratricopeptide (TPR) repeat protein